MDTLGNRIKILRKSRKLTQGRLGVLVGVSDVTIGYWEKDLNKPDFENLIKEKRKNKSIPRTKMS